MTDEQKETDPKKMTNTERKERWAENYLSRLWVLADSKDLYVKVVSYFRNQVRPRAEYTILRVNLKCIVDYFTYLKINGLIKSSSIGTEAGVLIRFANGFKKSFKKFTRQDIENFLQNLEDKSESYRMIYKRIIMAFFRFVHGIEKGDGYPNCVKWLKNNKPKNKEFPDILTIEEIGKLIEVADNFRDRAIVSLLFESGSRASEILCLKIKDVTFDNYGAVIIVSGKTGSRRIRLISSVVDLKAWLNTHGKRNDENAPLFYSLSRNSKFSFLSCNTLDELVNTLAERAGLQKRCTPHTFRHTRATHLAKLLTEQELKIYFGWTRTSNMAGVYVHLSGADIEDKILEINGIKQTKGSEIHKIPTIKCWNCKELNSIGNKFCSYCASPIDKDSTEVQRVREFKSFMLPKLVQLFKDGEMEKNDFIDAIELFEKEGEIKKNPDKTENKEVK
jgi:integrase